MNTNLDIIIEKFQNDQNLITINQVFPKVLYYVRSNMDGDSVPEKFMSRLNKHFSDLNIPFALTINIANKSMGLIFEGRAQEYVAIPLKIANMIRFNQGTFSPGVYNSEKEYDIDAFNTILDGELLYFRFGTFEEYKLPMNEVENLNPKSVVNELNNSFKNTLYSDLKINFKLHKDLLSCEMNRDDVEVILPSALSKYLGVNEKLVYTNGTSVNVQESIAKEEEQIEEQEEFDEDEGDQTPIPPPSVPRKSLLVLLDCVDNQYFNNKPYPLLRRTNLTDDYKSENREYFDPVIFMPVNRQDIKQLRVKFVDEYGQNLDFGNNLTVIEIYFKPKYEN